jgi:hypothetical protein
MIVSLTRWVARIVLAGAAVTLVVASLTWLTVIIGGYPASLDIEPGRFFSTLRSVGVWAFSIAIGGWIFLRWYEADRHAR